MATPALLLISALSARPLQPRVAHIACLGVLAQAPQLRLVDIRGFVRGGQIAPALALALARGPPAASGPAGFTVVCSRSTTESFELDGARRVLEAAGKVRAPRSCAKPGILSP